MEHPLSLSFVFVGLFFIAASVGYIITVLMDSKRRVPVPAVGTVFRFRAPQAMYRTRFLGVRNGLWAFSAPLSRNTYVPLHPGERLIAEGCFPNGVLLFRTEVAGRSLEDHSFEVKPPADGRLKERREDERVLLPFDRPVFVERVESKALDLSPCGIRVDTRAHLQRGERVRIDLPDRAEPLFGWVLEYDQRTARIRFEDRIEIV